MFKGNYIINYTRNPSAVLGDTNLESLIKSYEKTLSQRTNVALASAVTAYSRMIINQHKLTAIRIGATIYYSDTDSLVLNKALPSYLVDNAKLGMLKLEHKIKEGIFVLPKI
jgi:hypothetical protein